MTNNSVHVNAEVLDSRRLSVMVWILSDLGNGDNAMELKLVMNDLSDRHQDGVLPLDALRVEVSKCENLGDSILLTFHSDGLEHGSDLSLYGRS